jgi:hypothetical protein
MLPDSSLVESRLGSRVGPQRTRAAAIETAPSRESFPTAGQATHPSPECRRPAATAPSTVAHGSGSVAAITPGGAGMEVVGRFATAFSAADEKSACGRKSLQVPGS